MICFHPLLVHQARGVSNLAYTYALIAYVPKFDDESDLLDLLATQAAESTAEFNAQDISNIVWAYATVNKLHMTCFAAMGGQVVVSSIWVSSSLRNSPLPCGRMPRLVSIIQNYSRRT
jgi:hypothetical protein